MNDFVTFKLNTLLHNHIHDFIKCYESSTEFKNLKNLQERLSKQNDLFKLIVQENVSINSNVHFAMSSRKHELVYLRQVCKKILPFLLPDNVSRSK